MKLKIGIVTIWILGVLSITSCTSRTLLLRSGEFDHVRTAIYQNKPLEVPRFISKNPTINPDLVLLGSLYFPISTEKKAEEALKPPGLDLMYNLKDIEEEVLQTNVRD